MIEVINLGLCHYKEAHELQKNLVEKVRFAPEKEFMVICRHHPVVTLGKKSLESDVCGWQGDVYPIERGGRVTYHGPGQVVAYPIVSLQKRNRDIYLYLRAIETAVVKALSDYQLESNGDPDNTGVWVGNQKIASIGIAVKRWVTYHGIAFNLEQDPQAFQGINPCGFSTETMTDLETLLKTKVDRELFEQNFVDHLTNELNSLIITDFPSVSF